MNFEKETLAELQRDEAALLKRLKLVTTKATTNMVLFDTQEKLAKYSTVSDIMTEFFDVRMEFYVKVSL